MNFLEQLNTMYNKVDYLDSNGFIYFTPIKMNDVQGLVAAPECDCHFIGVLYDTEIADCNRCKFHLSRGCKYDLKDVVK